MASSGREQGAVFIDRDGVICENRPDYLRTWSDFAFIPGAIEALSALRRAGHRLIVVTNQSVVGRGLLSRRALDIIHEKMLDALSASGAQIDAVMVCPHHPDDRCACRKPEPGLLIEAAEQRKLDLRSAWFVGDHISDVEAGARAGCETILVRTGRGHAIADAAHTWAYAPDFVADDLVDAALWIMARHAARGGISLASGAAKTEGNRG